MVKKSLFAFCLAILMAVPMYPSHSSDDAAVKKHMINRAIEDFSLPYLYKEELCNIDTLKGEVHIVVFFASWCPFCRSEHPFIMDLAKEYSNVSFVGIAYKDREKKTKKFLEDHGNPFQHVLMDQKASLSKTWGLKGIPAFFIIDKNAQIRYHKSGGIDKEVFESQALPILNALKAE